MFISFTSSSSNEILKGIVYYMPVYPFSKPVQENRQILGIMYTCKTNLVILKDLAMDSPLHVIFLEKIIQ